MPADDDTNMLLGKLLERTDSIVKTVAKLDDVTDTIRSDQTNGRREIDFVKEMMKETREMIDASAPVLQAHAKLLAEHAENFDKIMPLVPSMQELDNGLKGVKKGVKKGGVIIGGIAVSPYAPSVWGWLKPVIHWPWF